MWTSGSNKDFNSSDLMPDNYGSSWYEVQNISTNWANSPFTNTYQTGVNSPYTYGAVHSIRTGSMKIQYYYPHTGSQEDHIWFRTSWEADLDSWDYSWERIFTTANNIHTQHYVRADGGFFVDGTAKGINGSGNFVGGTITGASDANVSNWNTAYGWGNHGSAGYLTTSSAASTYAPLASPALTGTPTAPTAGSTTNTTQIATTAFVQTAVSNLVDSAPGTLDTLNELAAALGDDANFSTTVTNSIATKLPKAGGTMTGALTINNFGVLKNWNSSNTDIDGLIDGSTFGGLLQGPSSGHFMVGLKDNDTSDSFAVISGSGNYTTDSTYDKLCLRVKADGSVEVPNGNIIMGSQYGIRFNDANTRIYTNSESPEDLIIEADQDLHLNPDGNVGIGSTAPAAKLNVASTGTNAYSSTITKGTNMKGIINALSNNADDMVGVYFGTGTTSEGTHWSGITGSRSQSITDWSTQLNFYTHNEDLANITTATQKMVIKGNGNVGIGTTSPSAVDTNNGTPKLQVETGASAGNNPLVARFTVDADAGDNSGASILINSGNDRGLMISCLLYTSPSPRDGLLSRMPSSA